MARRRDSALDRGSDLREGCDAPAVGCHAKQPPSCICTRLQISDNVPMPALRLVSFTAADLTSVAPWFDDPETCRWLGSRGWPEMILRLTGDPPAEHRGREVVDRRAWIVEEGDVRVG